MTRDADYEPSADLLERRYANHFQVGHNATEFVLDCGQQYGDSDTPAFHIRLVMVPMHALNLLEVLQQAVGQHEGMYGQIRTSNSKVIEPRIRQEDQ